MEYSEYLKTDHWKQLAEETKRLAGYRCQVCNSDGELHAHHRTYERKGDELQGDLVCLCKDCHQLYHDKQNYPILSLEVDVIKSTTIYYLHCIIIEMSNIPNIPDAVNEKIIEALNIIERHKKIIKDRKLQE